MSILDWLKGNPQTPAGRESAARAGAPAAGGGKPGALKNGAARTATAETSSEVAARRKSERARLRDLLYNVVRESMVRVGVLSSSFKFKVLATDPRGRKFIVMMDLSREFSCEISHLAEIETLICQAAKSRHNIVVSTVYWRAEDAAMDSRTGSTHPGERHRSPAAPPAKASGAGAMAHAAPQTRSKPDPDPILAHEITALKRALAGGGAGAAPAMSASDNPALLTGFENTEIIESELPEPEPEIAEDEHRESEIAETEMLDDEAHHPALSPTQYGDLR